MSRPGVLRAATAAALLGLTTGGLAVVAPQAHADPRPTDPQPTAVTLVLAAPDAAALDLLAQQDGLSQRTRLARLAGLEPGSDTVSDVVEDLQDRGLAVTGTTSWTVQVEGTAGRIRQVLGTGSAVPRFLRGDVAAVAAPTGVPLEHHAATPITGVDVRNAGAAATRPASTGTTTSGFTIATVQFSDWDSSDLTAYASGLGLPDPVATHQYQPVDVLGGPLDDDGAAEVALDQEALLATSPAARQRAYFAPNDTSNFVELLAQIDDDAVADNISAVSSSWGACESQFGTDVIAATENLLDALAVKGVTVFSASGDQGIYDCRGSGVGVDYPASSPGVVGVGGTTLTGTPGGANTGSNWTETGWSGSGGGASAVFTQPAWQSGHVSPAYTGGARLVPDIASVGDPRSGLRIITGGQQATYGGTSLAAPLSAAMLTNALADAGRSHGVGDVHEALYTAYDRTWCRSPSDPTTAVRDVTAGVNGYSRDRGANPSVYANPGYDTVTGVGSVLWSAVLPFVGGSAGGPAACASPPAPRVDPLTATPTRPTPSAAVSVVRPRRGRHPARSTVTASWNVTTPAARIVVTVHDVTALKTLLTSAAASGSASLKVRKRHRVTITVTAYDAAGAAYPASATVRTPRR